MSGYPGDSKALGVLLGFQREIRAFVASSDQRNLSSVSWWLYRSAGGAPTTTGRGAWPTADGLHALAQRLHARLARGGGGRSNRRTMKLRLTVAQVRVLLRDLLLVASGLRPSCLVDCCALTKELARLLLDGLAHEHDPDQQWSDVRHVRAVLLDGNVFFVHVDAFVREKMATGLLWQQMVVDVSARLARPKRINSNSSDADAARLNALAAWTVGACHNLLASTASRVLEWERPATLNATALAGILLCYPCVYDVSRGDGEDAADEWSEQDNCLAMCPLFLLQTAVILPPQQLETALHEFSVPQHLLHDLNDQEHEQELGVDVDSLELPLLKLLRARCRLQLQRAIGQSYFAASNAQPQVRVGTRTLPRVAL
ncbi:hypothetical protein PHYPSEUDO_010864 [Phytophthora pseudosyringae]|uniref:Uncharacterized protein n=1 Tax=Phytophthora pseudosyringae TaxID=221518 RepID=A0A8T1VA67_9STRA|nr:hypothetical protein PHYPSEUDO_010864 [Phytophthora pseudosyringae]